MARKKALVILPTYNEFENLKPMVEQILSCNRDYDFFDINLVIVDDNSPDGTGKLADDIARTHKNVSVIHRSAKLGLGSAHAEGFRYGVKGNFDYIITMDADFSHDPKYLPALVMFMAYNDLVIGSRYVPGGEVASCKLSRRIFSGCANAYIITLLGIKARDCTAGFRCYKRELLLKLDLDRNYSKRYSYLVEMLYRSQRVGAKIGEVPIIFKNREQGFTKFCTREIFMSLRTVSHFALDRFGIIKQKSL